MFNNDTIAAISSAAAAHGIEAAAMLAVCEVESGGQAFALVNGRQEPLIRFEGHYFDRRLSGDALKKARAAHLASPVAGKIANPVSQAARWAMLARAIEIDADAAYESVSWGLGQVMGAHWKALGFGSVTEMVNACRSGVQGQADVMARFIEMAGLKAALGRHDWPAFARGYNGAGYARNGYDRKISQAYAKYAGAGVTAHPTLRRGATGASVVALQEKLAISADGAFGPVTEKAVKAFQAAHGLTADGIVGAKTWAALDA